MCAEKMQRGDAQRASRIGVSCLQTYLKRAVSYSTQVAHLPDLHRLIKFGYCCLVGRVEDHGDQVAGNAEDEIGDRIAAIRESELLFGDNSLLAMFGPIVVHICASPGRYKVRRDPISGM